MTNATQNVNRINTPMLLTKKKILSVVPFSSCPQSFPASGSFQMSQLSKSGGQRIGVSASISVLQFSKYMSFASLGRFILKYFILFDVMVNGIVSSISVSFFFFF